MQLMPATAATLGVEDSFKPEENVRGGSAYLDSLLTRYHNNMALALAAYNAGPLAVDQITTAFRLIARRGLRGASHSRVQSPGDGAPGAGQAWPHLRMSQSIRAR